MRYKLVIWKLLPCFQNPGDFSQPNQTSSATNTFSKHSNLFLQNGLQPYFFFQDVFSKFPNLLLLLVPGGQPWQHLLFSFCSGINWVWTRILKFLQLHYYCVKCQILSFAHSSWIQTILSKTCQMLDKRRLRNLGESIIERVLVVVAFQSLPGTPSQFLLD